MEKILLLRQLTTLMASGISIIQCCDILANSLAKPSSRLMMQQIKHHILKGNNLSNSLRRHPNYFDEITCRLIQLGEQTGKIESLILMATQYQERNYRLKQTVKQALLYPCIVSITAFLVICCLIFFVIPQFATLYHDTQTELPLITTMLFTVSFTLRKYAWLGLGSLISLIVYITYCTPPGNVRKHLSNVIHRAPIIHHFFKKITLLRFTRQLALTLSAGIPMTTALQLTTKTCLHFDFKMNIAYTCKQVNAGLSLHQALSHAACFPSILIQLVKIGEESGRIEEMIDKFSDLTETEVHQFTHQFNQLLEPLIIIVLGVLIGGVVVGMYLPIFKLGSVI